jgi:hypothetical protein
VPTDLTQLGKYLECQCCGFGVAMGFGFWLAQALGEGFDDHVLLCYKLKEG